MRLDEIMPRYEFNEVHQIAVSAPPGRVLDAVKQVTPGEMWLTRLLFGLRSVPAILKGSRALPTSPAMPLYAQMLGVGFVELAEDPTRELVVVGIGQPWRLTLTVTDSPPVIRGVGEFTAFEAPGLHEGRDQPCR